MEWITSILSWIDTNKTIIGGACAAAWGLCTFRYNQKAERQMKLYDKTLAYYESLSCELFSCMDKLCDKQKLKESKESYDRLMCGAGQAILVAPPELRDQISYLLESIISENLESKEKECHKLITSIVKLMNEHLNSLISKKIN
ncbi:hypothetical protein [Klebsiella michiganensis]|uniref:hypothetical protein n=1 Tax=Klebsiella michiganensis TaxID=1134687 RepID=UPI00190A9770|nr:hypothetical protein [Klebsiella michiganensis]MBK4127699.1 hypothetical protein [Klebsiella michiganensis]